MQVTMRYFGQLRHLACRDEESVTVPADTTVSMAVRRAVTPYGDDALHIVADGTGTLRPSLMIVVNDVPIDKSNPPDLRDGDTITLLSAISGG